MKFYILLCFVFCSISAFAQNDSTIEKNYAKTQAGGGKYILVKTSPSDAAVLKKRFRTAIKRQVNEQWFVLDAAMFPAINQRIKVIQTLPANNNWKFSTRLLALQKQASPGAFNFTIEVSDDAAFIKTIAGHAEMIKESAYHIYIVQSSPSFINKLAEEDFVLSIDLRTTAPKEETVINGYESSTNALNLLASKYPAADGNGLAVSVKENLFDTTDIDFKGRYKNIGLNSAEVTAHATIMSTLIGGGGNSFYTGKGVAPAVTLSSANFANLLPDGSIYQQQNISVQNHSYGVGIENFYGSDAAAYDQSMIDNPALLHVFSSGNIGTSSDTAADSRYKNIAGFANLTGSFKMAKNILTVGSVDSFLVVPPLSSKGPAYDGRIKPELVAYGNDGSSGAAAITSGTVLAIQSAYAQEHSGTLPANTLVKAVIINSADDINKVAPDFTSGYGNVNAFNAVKDISSGNFFSGMVAEGETKDFNLTVPANAKNLKVTLVWTDPPAQTNAFTALVNDLDLSLQRQQTTWLPWVLNSAPDQDSLKQSAKRGRDSLNVVEQVSLTNPNTGNYIIHVNGYDIASGTQAFYIAYRWDTADSFYFVSPAAKDYFTSGDLNIFRWKSTYATGTTGKLEYSIDKGTSWQLIDNAANLDTVLYKFTAPNIFSTALARMTVGSDVYLSDTFNFSAPLSPHVGFNCTDSVLIYWNSAPNVSTYKVYTLGDKYLQPFATTADTSIIAPKAGLSSYVAVTTVLEDNATGVNSYAFNYETQGVGCYISNFLADPTTTRTALLQLSIGTTYHVASVNFQRLTATGWVTINEIKPVTSLELSYEDAALHAGINTYRAQLILTNGQTITSETGTVYFTGNAQFSVLPNPVPQGQKLTIISDNFQQNEAILYDLTGRKVLQQTFNNTRTDLDVSHIARGIYFLVIYFEGNKLFSAKILVH